MIPDAFVNLSSGLIGAVIGSALTIWYTWGQKRAADAKRRASIASGILREIQTVTVQFAVMNRKLAEGSASTEVPKWISEFRWCNRLVEFAEMFDGPTGSQIHDFVSLSHSVAVVSENLVLFLESGDETSATRLKNQCRRNIREAIEIGLALETRLIDCGAVQRVVTQRRSDEAITEAIERYRVFAGAQLPDSLATRAADDYPKPFIRRNAAALGRLWHWYCDRVGIAEHHR